MLRRACDQFEAGLGTSCGLVPGREEAVGRARSPCPAQTGDEPYEKPGEGDSWGRDGRTPASSQNGNHDSPGSLGGRVAGAPERDPYAGRLARPRRG
jgi:hypothetical protein